MKFYYAFTYPFTYTDCQQQLDVFDKLYVKSTKEKETPPGVIENCDNIIENTDEQPQEDFVFQSDTDQSGIHHIPLLCIVIKMCTFLLFSCPRTSA